MTAIVVLGFPLIILYIHMFPFSDIQVHVSYLFVFIQDSCIQQVPLGVRGAALADWNLYLWCGVWQYVPQVVLLEICT